MEELSDVVDLLPAQDFYHVLHPGNSPPAPARVCRATVGGCTQAATQTHTHAFNANKVLLNVLLGAGSVESVPAEVRYYTTDARLSRLAGFYIKP